MYDGALQVEIEETSTNRKFISLLHYKCYKILYDLEDSDINNKELY